MAGPALSQDVTIYVTQDPPDAMRLGVQCLVLAGRYAKAQFTMTTVTHRKVAPSFGCSLAPAEAIPTKCSCQDLIEEWSVRGVNQYDVDMTTGLTSRSRTTDHSFACCTSHAIDSVSLLRQDERLA